MIWQVLFAAESMTVYCLKSDLTVKIDNDFVVMLYNVFNDATFIRYSIRFLDVAFLYLDCRVTLG